MAVFRCNACQATFTSPQGVYLYFHACSPLNVRELLALPDPTLVTSDPLVLADIAAAKGPASVTVGVTGPAELAQGRLSQTAIKRVGHVDQNIVLRPPHPATDPPPDVISTGAGVTQIGA